MNIEKNTIVISGINLREGGPLTILTDCLTFLSQSNLSKEYKIVALVHDRSLCDFPNIEYIEYSKSSSNWLYRLYYEYFHFRNLSKKLKPYLWLSLHDITPNVYSEKKAVYMHNLSIFNKIKLRDYKYDIKYILFACLYKYLYKINIRKNDYCIVQQNWLRDSFSDIFNIQKNKFIVASPKTQNDNVIKDVKYNHCKSFFFPSFPRPFKNFETVCEAAKILEKSGIEDIEITLTIDSHLSNYAYDIVEKYKDVKIIRFVGILDKNQMMEYYNKTDCLIFPSRLETWGLPISEFIPFEKPMILADLPYAYETSQGAASVAFYPVNNSKKLADLMKDLYNGNYSEFNAQPIVEVNQPYAPNYAKLFEILLQ